MTPRRRGRGRGGGGGGGREGGREGEWEGEWEGEREGRGGSEGVVIGERKRKMLLYVWIVTACLNSLRVMGLYLDPLRVGSLRNGPVTH